MYASKHNLLNKILVCGASLVMLGSTGASIANNTANAKSVHHHAHIYHLYHQHKHHISNRGYHHYNHHKRNHRRKHIRYHRVSNSYHSSYLSYNQLIPTIRSAYHQLFNNGGNVTPSLYQKMLLVDNTITHNAGQYNHSQVKQILDSDYSETLSHPATRALTNSLKSNPNVVNGLSSYQSPVNINQHHHKIHKVHKTHRIHKQQQVNGTVQTRQSHPVNFLPTDNKDSQQGTLSFNQIIPTVNSVYGAIKDGEGGFDTPSLVKKIELVNNTITQNAGHYNLNQLRQLRNSYDYLYFSDSASNAINNQLNKHSQAQVSQAWNNRGNNDFANQVAQYDYDYINQAREEDGLKPLPINNYTQEVANMRSKQYTHDMEAHDNNTLEAENADGDNAPSDNLAHGFDYHDTSDDDAHKLGIKDNNGTSENAGTINRGYNDETGDRFGDKDHAEYNYTPQEIAYNDVNDMLNYDRFTKNGHRDTILDKDATGIGVSSYYHSNGVTGHDTEYTPSNGGIIQDYSYGHNPANI